MEPWLISAAAKRPERPALITGRGELSYAELAVAARRAADGLRRRGVSDGDRVALALPAGPAFAAALHGTWLLGAIAVPVDLRLSDPERERRMQGVAAVVDTPLEAQDGQDAPGVAVTVSSPVLFTRSLSVPATNTPVFRP